MVREAQDRAGNNVRHGKSLMERCEFLLTGTVPAAATAPECRRDTGVCRGFFNCERWSESAARGGSDGGLKLQRSDDHRY